MTFVEAAEANGITFRCPMCQRGEPCGESDAMRPDVETGLLAILTPDELRAMKPEPVETVTSTAYVHAIPQPEFRSTLALQNATRAQGRK